MTNNINPGQFTILGFEGIIPDKDFLCLIEKYPPAGFLLLEQNYESPEQLTSLVSDLKKVAGETVLFAVDQEPGRVQRFKKDFPASEKPSVYIEDGLEDKYRLWCAHTSSKLAEVGINLNLAPVLDIASDPGDNPALTDRIFGDDPGIAAFYAGILIEEHKKNGILTCGKHFPGLGSARFDPHVELSLSDDPLARFEDYYWQPFIKAVESGVDMVMTTHLKAASLDPHNAATYSPKVVGYLRNNVNFAGPVVSDDLIMGGARNAVSPGDSAIKAIASGHNLLIISRGVVLQSEVLDSLKNRYARDHLFGKIAHQNAEIIRRIQSKTYFSDPRK
ncbi:MAG: glycoside hydrolase family 3 protein [Candidatus Zixiibacteriota bacterium]|nr:MAG: glycoside hydrolase family 3 protein [candidate division Zixibacteria bacterium]